MNGTAPATHRRSLREKLDDLPEMITRQQVMALLQIDHPRTLRVMHDADPPLFPPPLRFNQRLHRWLKADVLAWFAKNRKELLG